MISLIEIVGKGAYILTIGAVTYVMCFFVQVALVTLLSALDRLPHLVGAVSSPRPRPYFFQGLLKKQHVALPIALAFFVLRLVPTVGILILMVPYVWGTPLWQLLFHVG